MQPTAWDLVRSVAAWWPGLDVNDAVVRHGMSHDVVVVPGSVAVRVARTAEAENELRRSAAVLTVLANRQLLFAVPEPLGPVTSIAGRAALATTFIAGTPRPVPDPGLTDPAVLSAAVTALAAVPPADIAPAVGELRGQAGGTVWAADAHRLLLPELEPSGADMVARAVETATRLPTPAEPVLVHGDLAGTNLLWKADHLTGVLDWDLAFLGDQAYDIACLADGFGWTTLTTLFDAATIDRARAYRDVFLVESYLAQHRRGETAAANQILELLRRQIHRGTVAPPTPT